MGSGQKQGLKNQNTPSGQKQKMMTLDFNRSLTFKLVNENLSKDKELLQIERTLSLSRTLLFFLIG